MNRRLSAFLIAFALLLILLYAGQSVMDAMTDKGILLLTDGWDAEISGETDYALHNINPENLHAAGVPALKRGESLTLRRTLDEIPEVNYPAMMIESRMSAVEVFLDGEPVASFHTEELEEGELVCDSVSFVDLLPAYKGRTLEITYRPSENLRMLYNLPAPQIGDYDALTRAYTNRTFIPLVMGIFLIVFGMGMIIMMTLYVTYLQRFEANIVTGMLCVALGAWILLREQATVFMAPELHVTVWEHVFLYLIIPLLYAYLTGVPRIGNENVFRAIAGTSSVLPLSFIPLHFSGIAHITSFLPLFYVLALTGTVLSSVYLYRLLKDKRFDTSEGIRIGGIAGMSIMNLISIFAEYASEYFGIYRRPALTALFPVGAAFFVMSQMIDYFIYVTGYYAKKEENTSLSDIAFVDALTGLANRAEWDKRMNELESASGEYCILSMDLNGLKALNDREGHAKGDKLLKTFARIIRECFRDEDFAARIGGDEFVVIMEDINDWLPETYVKYMERRLSDLDRRERGINHSCSYGYAFRREAQDAHGVYMLADTRMYEHKAIQKGKKVV